MRCKHLQIKKVNTRCLRLFYLAFVFMFSVSGLLAQEITVTGTVTDQQDGSPLPGVNILIQGTVTGTTTDVVGTYTIRVPSEETVLIFTYVGYNTVEEKVGSRSVIDIGMNPDITQLSEVVVTSLGIERAKKEISYAAQNVSADELSEARELNVMNSLAGKVAGLDIVRSSAGVGSASRVILRGNRSIAGNNQPLYIVDGVPISNFSWGTPDSENGGVQQGDGIGNVNPDDIATITVLKGPNATALYGSRANNGAIVITTKSGVSRKGIGVEFNTNWSIDKALILTKFQNVYGQGNGGTYIKNSEEGWGAKMEGQMVEHWSPDPNWAGPAEYPYSPHDNFHDFFNTGYNIANTLTLTGGNDMVRGLFSFTNTITAGIVPTNGLERNNFNLRFDGDLSDKLSFDTKVTYFTQNVHNRLSTGDDFNNPMRAIYRQPSNISLDDVMNFEFFDDAGIRKQNYWNPGTNGGENIYWMLNRTIRDEKRDRVIAMGSLKYQFTDHLSLMVRTALDQIYDVWSYKQYYNTFTIADAGNLNLQNNNSLETNHDFLLNYNNMWGGDTWSLTASVGGNLLYQKTETLNTRTNRLLKPNLFVITNTSQILSDQGGSEKKIHSLYAFATLGYKSFLFLNATARNDWSSTLPKENWSYFYPSVGLNWVISDMINTLPSFLSLASVRVNYAEVGNDTDPYKLSKTYNFGAGGQLGYAWRSGELPAEDLKPEKTKSWEAGFNLAFLQNRLGLDFTWYKSNTFNQLISVPLPPPSGYSSKFINAGNVQNTGIELTLNATPVIAGDFRWDLAFNYARNVSEVIEITEDLKEYTIRGRSWMTTIKVVEGEPYGQIFTRGFERNDEGRLLINDLGLPITTPGQTVQMGNFNPDWMGGFSNSFSYKGIELSLLLDIRMGGDVFSFTECNLTFDGYSEATLAGRDGFVVDGLHVITDEDGNVTGYEENTIETNAEAYWHSLGGRNTPIGEPYRYDASYVRVREVLLGYTWNFESTIFQSINVSLYGRNLGFLYNPSEIIDPNMNIGTGNVTGLEAFAVPSARTYGINARFRF
jgi:TonB-linked SusC/RagA family outer membrane protein